jgi:hypothetical protein
MSEKKIGPREAQLRAMREARVEANKKMMDNAFKANKAETRKGGKVQVQFKPSKRSGRGR